VSVLVNEFQLKGHKSFK